MTAVVTTFPGSQVEAFAFLEAVSHNCACRWAPFGLLIEGCELHHDMAQDDTWLKHSVYARRLAPKLLQEEFMAA